MHLALDSMVLLEKRVLKGKGSVQAACQLPPFIFIIKNFMSEIK